MFCYQFIRKDDGILGSDDPISDSKDIFHCSEPLTNEETRDTEVFLILSSLSIEIILISDTSENIHNLEKMRLSEYLSKYLLVYSVS